MSNISDLNFEQYPALVLFLSENVNPDILPFLECEYEFNDFGATETHSLLEICATFGKLNHLDAVLKYFPRNHDHLMKSFVEAAENLQIEIMVRLLEDPGLFNQIEAEEEYTDFISPYVDAIILRFAQRYAYFRQTNPNQDFDITEEELPHLYVVLRNIIRRNLPGNGTIVTRLLLGVPRLFTLDVESARELYHLAGEVDNHAARHILQQLPSLAGLEEGNLDDELGLRETAEDHESSIRSLTPSEKKMLDAVVTQYGSKLTKEDEKRLFIEFKETLKDRYEKNPAKVILKGNIPLELPFTWEEFEELGLSGREREQALIAYYKHPDHTVHRFLSKPNHWIDPDAPYRKYDVEHPEWGNYADFEGYISEIVHLWLAASDELATPTEGYTLEGRIENFIKELSLIARGHNWDRRRPVLGPDKQPLKNSRGQIITEEYDDLRPDSPSCYSGQPRRLFQSVLGHPLLTILTHEIVQQETYDFIREHYVNLLDTITNSEKRLLARDLDEIFVNLEKPSDLLKKYNLPQSKENELIKHLHKKWGPQFKEDPYFLTIIHKTFSLKSDESHLSKFYESHALKPLLDPCEPAILFQKGLKRMETKVRELETKALRNQKEYIAAAKISRRLVTLLAEQGELCFVKKTLGIIPFKAACIKLINEAKPVLEKHRGWGEILYDFAFLLTNILTAGLASAINLYYTGEVRFFKVPRTDSLNRLMAFQNELNIVCEEEDIFQQERSLPAPIPVA